MKHRRCSLGIGSTSRPASRPSRLVTSTDLDERFRVSGLGFRVQGLGLKPGRRVKGLGFRGLGFKGLGFKGFRVFRVEGFGIMVVAENQTE